MMLAENDLPLFESTAAATVSDYYFTRFKCGASV